MSSVDDGSFTLPVKKFYVADCAVTHFEETDISASNSKVAAAYTCLSGTATLVSGEVEMDFQWVATLTSLPKGALHVDIEVDEECPNFHLLPNQKISPESLVSVCTQILSASNWKSEVAECLPTTQAELAKL
jgi:hypothetical protein